MSGDVPPGAGEGVLGHEAASPVQQAARPGDGAAQPARLAQLAGGDADQRDQVVGLPQPVGVGLAKPGAAAQRTAPGRRAVYRHHGAQLGAGGAEGAPPAALDHLDPAGAEVAQGLAHRGAGERVLHGEKNPFGRLPSGCGK